MKITLSLSTRFVGLSRQQTRHRDKANWPDSTSSTFRAASFLSRLYTSQTLATYARYRPWCFEQWRKTASLFNATYLGVNGLKRLRLKPKYSTDLSTRRIFSHYGGGAAVFGRRLQKCHHHLFPYEEINLSFTDLGLLKNILRVFFTRYTSIRSRHKRLFS